MIVATAELKNTVTAHDGDPVTHLVEMVQLDLVLRTTRQNISDLESQVDMHTGSYSAIKQHIDLFVNAYSRQQYLAAAAANTANNNPGTDTSQRLFYTVPDTSSFSYPYALRWHACHSQRTSNRLPDRRA